LFKRVSARGFYALINVLSEIPIPADTGDFRLMDRAVVDILRQMPERHRFLRGMVAWTGFHQTAITYDRPERFAGQTKYPLAKMVRYALDGILSFSTRPLQMAVGLGADHCRFGLGRDCLCVGHAGFHLGLGSKGGLP
jgi:polyisoprenyl-phosphate glycosyltransferase